MKLDIGEEHFDMLLYGLICARKTVTKELANEYRVLIKVLIEMAEMEEDREKEKKEAIEFG